MATTQCLTVAVYIPTTPPHIGDAVQVTEAIPLRTRFIEIAGGSFPLPNEEGDMLMANAALAWVAVPVSTFLPDPIRVGDYMVANASLQWSSQVPPPVLSLPAPGAEGNVLQADASLAWVSARIDGGAA